MAYHPRRFSNSPLYRLLQAHWDTFLASYDDQFQRPLGALRSVVEQVVPRFMDCGNPMNGFARIRCPDCGHERLLAFSCKCRGFCPSCQARRAEEWAVWVIEERLEEVPHHHVVFTIPKMLRAYFRYDRSLLNGLSRAAYLTMQRYLEGLRDSEAIPGMIVASQTFGAGARFHPHLHTILTSGSWDGEGTWKSVFGWDRPVLRELFQIEVFRFLRERELLSTERIDLIRSWRHSGFDVYVGEPVAPDDQRTLEHVARYLLRAPVSLERMRYDPQAARVTILPLSGEQGGVVELEALEFIARLILHIPDVRERQVLYYGAYANASRLRARQRASAGSVNSRPSSSDLEAPTPYEQQRRMRWAQLIRRVWLEDPLLCPDCGGEMQILSFITEQEVVDRILRHVGWRHGASLPGVIRPPPVVLKVAESPA
ncbi:transposase zinc-binding domain-containing protein [Gemmatimonadota bacterium]